MKLTLATCALGALGLTPALYGSHEVPQAPTAPLPALKTVALHPAALVPPAPPARLFVSTLQEQSGSQDLEREAAKLKGEIQRLRDELKSMQKDLKNSKSARKAKANAKSEKKAKAKSKGKALSQEREIAEEREVVEGRRRVRGLARVQEREALEEVIEERNERMEERRAHAQERRQEAEERRVVIRERAGEARERAEEARERAEEHRVRAREIAEVARVHASEAAGHAGLWVKGSVDGQKGLAKSRVLIGKSKDGKTFKWSGDEDEDVQVFFMDEDDKSGQKHVIKKIVGGGKDTGIFSFKADATNQFPGAGGKMEVGGPNTFHIHVEEGDVHIHTNGPSSISTTTTKTSSSGSGSGGHPTHLFGALNHTGPHTAPHVGVFSAPHGDAHDGLHFFAKVMAEDGSEPIIEMNLNGQEIGLDNIESILGAVGTDLGGMALQGILGEIEGLDGLKGLDVDIDFDFDDLEGLEGIGGNIEEALKALEALEGNEGFNFDIDFDFDGDDCDEECDEDEDEDHDDAEDDDSRDERFVNFGTKNVFRVRPFGGNSEIFKLSAPAKANFGAQLPAFRLSGGKAPIAGPTAEQELLNLAREIQADVEAMRAELNELREEVRSAPRRR